jgi:cathepsin B
MKAEISANGPIVSNFAPDTDFLNYASGVYEAVSGGTLGSYYVKIVGYGTENDVPYWICSMYWGTSFGDQGYFKVK